MPIGLPDAGRRQTDVLVRKLVGPRWASVFMTPVRAALAEEDYAAATAANARIAGKGISRQAYGLRTKILEVDQCVTTPILDTLHISVYGPSCHAPNWAELPVIDLVQNS